MIETQEQHAQGMDELRTFGNTEIFSMDNLRNLIEALREVARKAKEIVDGEEHYKGKESVNDYDATIEAICEELRDALSALEEKAPWLLEEE